LLYRSEEKELIDLGGAHYTEQEFIDCQKKLFRVNRLLGTFKSTLKILKKLKSTHSIMDVGCGGGLFILNLSRYLPKIKFIGNDISLPAISLALQERKNMGISESHVQFQLLPEPKLPSEENSVDIVLATMVCHHMSDSELITFLKQAINTAKDRVIINDLHRQTIAYGFYYLFSSLLFSNRLITHDGLISIKRGFKRHEWQYLLNQAEIKHYKIKWCFPFLWRITLWKK
jgi:2-polyprenyl-3-methyl-5-hydroxy-6-metoxy-1,4-benzoquinol methylase